MPRVPLVGSPEFAPAGTSNVRADPNMNAPMANAQQRMAGAVQDVAQTTGNIAARVKHATDTAYLIGSNSKLETANRDFKTWTETHKDTAEWDSEWEARQKAVLDDVQAGAGKLGREAKLQLQTETQSWQRRSKSVNSQFATIQNIENAKGTAEESLALAVANNDEAGARAIIEVGTSQGLWNASHAAAMGKRVTVGIATNQANADVMADPFTAPERLMEKGENGEYVNYPGLSPAARSSMMYRANRTASQTRSATQREWSQLVADANEHGTPMPDEEAIKEEAARQGINPKWVAKLFKAPQEFDPAEYAEAFNEISQLDLESDETGQNQARAVEITTQFKPGSFAARQLEALVRDRSQSDAPLTSPVAKAVMAQMREDRLYNGAFIPTGRTETIDKWFRDDVTKTHHFDGGLTQLRKLSEEEIKGIFGEKETLRSVQAMEQMQYAAQVTKMQDWLKKHPEATEIEAEEYRQSLVQPYVMKQVSETLAPKPNISKGDYAALPVGGKYWWNGQEQTKK
jgi:hypothetical protein